MVGHHWIPWISHHQTSGSIIVAAAKQEQDISSACLCTRKTKTCHQVCGVVTLSALCLSLFVACVALSVLYISVSDSKPRWRSLLYECQNISESHRTLTKTNAELRKDNHDLKEQTKLLNKTSVKLLSANVALSLDREELSEEVFNLTSVNSQLRLELDRLVRLTSEQAEKELNMSESIRHQEDSIGRREEEKRHLSETVHLLRDQLVQVKAKNQELLEISEKSEGEVRNLSEKLGVLMNDDCEEQNLLLQEREAELQEENQNLTQVLMKERKEAAEREESRKEEMDRKVAVQEAYRNLDLYCPVVDHKTKERVCKKCPDSWRLFENKCYYFSSHLLTWSASRAWCRTQGGDLVVINSEPEQRFIFESGRAQQQSGSRLWVGMTDAESEGDWSWVDGSSVASNTQYWLNRPGAGTEPDNWKQDDPSGEDCGHVDTSEKVLSSWMDASCKIPYRWICEKDV